MQHISRCVSKYLNTINFIGLVVLFLVIFLTIKFNWWVDFNLRKIDMYIFIFSLFFIFIKNYFITIYFLAFFLFANIYGLKPILANVLILFFSYSIGQGLFKFLKIKQ